MTGKKATGIMLFDPTITPSVLVDGAMARRLRQLPINAELSSVKTAVESRDWRRSICCALSLPEHGGTQAWQLIRQLIGPSGFGSAISNIPSSAVRRARMAAGLPTRCATTT